MFQFTGHFLTLCLRFSYHSNALRWLLFSPTLWMGKLRLQRQSWPTLGQPVRAERGRAPCDSQARAFTLPWSACHQLCSHILPHFLVRWQVPDCGGVSILREVTYAGSHSLTRQSWNRIHISWISSLFPPQPFILLACFQFRCIITNRKNLVFVFPTELKEPNPSHQEL